LIEHYLNGIWYHGIIDEVAIYERALTDSEVQKNYNEIMAISPVGNLATVWGKVKCGP